MWVTWTQTITWVKCINDNAGRVALVKKVSEVRTQVIWTWMMMWVMCVVIDIGRVALVEEVDEVARQ